MELQHLIRCKMLSLELTQALLNIARGNNIVEDLIDYIKIRDVEFSALEDIAESCACESLQEEINRLEREIEHNEERLMKLEEMEEEEEIKAESLNNLIEEYLTDHGRYPAINEV